MIVIIIIITIEALHFKKIPSQNLAFILNRIYNEGVNAEMYESYIFDAWWSDARRASWNTYLLLEPQQLRRDSRT